MTWQDRAIQLQPTSDNPQWTSVARVIQKEYCPDDDLLAVTDRVRAHLRRYYAKSGRKTCEVKVKEIDLSEKLAFSVKSGGTLQEIAQELGTSERVAQAMIEDMKDKGMCIDCDGGYYKVSNFPQDEVKTVVNDWRGEKIIRFGLTGDKHFGSKFCQIEHMHKAYEMFKAEGITDVYDTGDLTEGENMRAGHSYECYVHGADDYIEEVVKNHPRVDGLTTHYILGNHDLSFVKHVGMNIGKPISANRPDMNYLGIGQAYIKLTPNCTLELRHPGGGSAYAISYKAQKMVDAMPGGEKPNILALGHLHKVEYLFYRNIHIFQTGTLQAQSNFMRDNSLAAHVGFWIVTCHVRDDGEITRIIPELIPFYRAIPDDWKNWR